MHEIGPNSLSDLLSGGIYSLFLIMARVGVAFTFMPGLGDSNVSAMKRFIFTAAFCFVLLPVLGEKLPVMPTEPAEIVRLYAHEAMWGFFIGIMARLMLMALDMAGFLIASNAGLSAATSVNPSFSSSGPIVTTLLTMAAILIMFITNMHHMLFESIVHSYDVFKPGEALPAEDMSNMVVTVVSHATQLGFQLAAPFVVLGLVFNVGLGLLARLVPQMQVFLIGIPIQILVGMLLLGLIMMTIIQIWMSNLQDIYTGLLQ